MRNPLSLTVPARCALVARQSRHDLVMVSILVIVGALLRLLFFPSAPVFVHGDSPTYYAPADALLNSGEILVDLKRPPLYSAFIALVARVLGDDLRTLILVQHSLGVATSVLAYAVGRLTLGRGVGLLAGLSAALSGGLLLDEHSVMSETLFTFLLTLAVALCLAAVRSDAAWLPVVAGLVVGLAALTRPHAQVLLVATPLVAAAYGRAWRRGLRLALLIGLGSATLLVPWMARNQFVHGSFTLAGGLGQHLINQMADLHGDRYLFYDRSRPPEHADANRVVVRKFIQDRIDRKPRTVETTGRRIHARLMERLQLGSVETDNLLRDVALDVLREQPLAVASATTENLRKNLTGGPEGLRSRWNGWTTPGWPAHRQHLLQAPTQQQTVEFARADRLVRIYDGRAVGELVVPLFLIGLLASLIRPTWRLLLLPGLVVLALHSVTALVAGYEPRHYNPTSPLVHVVALSPFVLFWHLLRGAGFPGSARARLRALRTRRNTLPAAQPAAAWPAIGPDGAP